MSSLRRTLSLLAACLLPAAALATPPNSEPGPLDLRLDYEQATKTSLEQKTLKFSDPVKLITSFQVPDVVKGLRVELIISPRDAELTLDPQLGGTKYQGSDSDIDPAAILIGLNLTSLQPKTRLQLPFTLKPLGRNGSGVTVTLRVVGEGSSLATAGRALAADPTGQTRDTSFTTLAAEQHQALTKDVTVQRKVLLADGVLPFDEAQFADALKTESPKLVSLKDGAQ